MKANTFLRDAIYGDEAINPYAYCHHPIVVEDPVTLLGAVISRLRVNPESEVDDVIDDDLILLWSTEKRVITGGDILGRLLRGISSRGNVQAQFDEKSYEVPMSYFTKRYHPPGTRPGTLTLPGVAGPTPPRVSLIDYSETTFEESRSISPDDCRTFLDQPTITWIHVQGTADPETLLDLGHVFGLHELALEDIVNSGQRPKVELHDDQLFIILSHPILDDDFAGTEQVSLFLGQNFIISFHDGTHDPFQPIRMRLRKQTGRLRAKGAGYLLYALVDLVIDQCFPVLERYGSELEDLEEILLAEPAKDTLRRLHELKRDALLLRRMLWPQREVINNLMRDDDYPISDDIKPYFRDCYDHTIQIMDLLETYRDMTTGLVELYLSSVSNRLNEVMRVLTVIATIFIPLTFVVGIYGMNFGNNNQSPWAMPELNWYYGYPLTWGLMIAIAGGLLYVFKRNGWF